MDKKILTYGKAIVIVAAALVIMAVWWSHYEHSAIKRPLEELCQDKKFEGINAEAGFTGFLKKDSLVFNLKSVNRGDELTPLFLFFEYARKLNQHKFDKVTLQYKGKTKFIMEGLDFTRVGTQMQINEPSQMAIEFPPLMKKPNGLEAFKEPFGDPQWVSQKQVKNLRDFILEWYARDWVEEQAKKQMKNNDSDGKNSNGKPAPSVTGKVTPVPGDSSSPSPTLKIDIPDIQPEEL